MPGLTPTRVRLTLSQKVKIIEESKKSDFSRKKICEEYSISKAAISSILKDQKTHLENYDSGIPGKHKTMRNYQTSQKLSLLCMKDRGISIQTNKYH